MLAITFIVHCVYVYVLVLNSFVTGCLLNLASSWESMSLFASRSSEFQHPYMISSSHISSSLPSVSLSSARWICLWVSAVQWLSQYRLTQFVGDDSDDTRFTAILQDNLVKPVQGCLRSEFFWAWIFPSVLWRCWLGNRKDIRPVKNLVLVCWWCCLPRSPGQLQHLKYQNRIWWWWIRMMELVVITETIRRGKLQSNCRYQYIEAWCFFT